MPYSHPRQVILDETPTMLQMQLYVVFTTPIPENDHLIDEVTPAHLDHQVRIEKAGHLLAAGPFWTEDEQHHTGDGMFILRAASIAEARALCDIDPMHTSGARRYTIRPWMMNEGGMTLRLSFSDQRFSIS